MSTTDRLKFRFTLLKRAPLVEAFHRVLHKPVHSHLEIDTLIDFQHPEPDVTRLRIDFIEYRIHANWASHAASTNRLVRYSPNSLTSLFLSTRNVSEG